MDGGILNYTTILYHGIHDTNEMEKHNILNGK